MFSCVLLLFQLCGFPWIFQQVSQVWATWLQWSHHNLLDLLCESKCWEFCSPVAKADMSLLGKDYDEVWSFIMTFFWLSSRQTLEHASWSDGSGLVLRTFPQTSLRFLLSPTKNVKILSFSTIFWYLMLFPTQSHSSSWTHPVVANIERECWSIGSL